MSFWQVAQCGWDEQHRPDQLLADRWEPFAVTEAPPGLATIWLRRDTERIKARSSAPRPRHEREVAQLAQS